jgi:hypothetical protein
VTLYIFTLTPRGVIQTEIGAPFKSQLEEAATAFRTRSDRFITFTIPGVALLPVSYPYARDF